MTVDGRRTTDDGGRMTADGGWRTAGKKRDRGGAVSFFFKKVFYQGSTIVKMV